MPVERLLSEYVPWEDYVEPDVIVLKDSSVLCMQVLEGLPFDTVSADVIDYQHGQLEAVLRDQAQDGLIYHVLQTRGLADPTIYPSGICTSAFAAALDDRYRESLFGQRRMWHNQSLLVIQVSPRKTGLMGFKRLLSKKYQTSIGSIRERVDQVNRISGIIAEQLAAYNPRRLTGMKWRGRRPFSEMAEAVAFAMTGYWRPVPLSTAGAAAIFSEVFIVGPEAFEVRMPHGASYGACLAMHDYPFQTEPGMFDRFLSASYRHTVYNGFRCIAPITGHELATRKQNRSRQAGDKAVDQQNELSLAANLIAGNRLLMGDYAFALTVFTDDADKLPQIVEKAWSDLAYGGMKIERENITLEGALFSMVPGNFHLRSRQAAVSSRNFCAAAGLHNFPQGVAKGFWGEAVGVMRTAGGTPFLFHLHAGGVGNCIVTGQTGAGKSVLLGWILCQAQRFGTQAVVWDKDRGLEVLIRALNGTYLSLTNMPGKGSGLAPLKRLCADDADDMEFLAGLLRSCISTPNEYEMTPEEDRRLNLGLKAVMRLPPSLRTLSEVRAFMGTSRDGAGARLEKWCWGSEFGWIIDCAADIVELDNDVIGFDQSSLIEDPIAAGAILGTLFHYTGKLVDGRKLLFILDEIWNALKIRQFNAQINNGLKTFRKYNSPILLGTQSPRDGLDSPIGHTIREQCPTQFYFSNPGARWADYGEQGMNMTPTCFDIVQNLPKGTGKALLIQDGVANVVQVPLAGFPELKVISGTATGLKALKIAQEQTDNPEDGVTLIENYARVLEEIS